MPDKLCVLVCSNFKKELDAAIQSEHFDNVTAAAFPARCGHPPLEWDEVKQALPADGNGLPVYMIGGCCVTALKSPPKDLDFINLHREDQCFYIAAARALVDRYLTEGAYLATPGWLADWRQKIADWGFVDRESAREFFSSSISRLVLLDTGVEPGSLAHLQEFAGFVDLPYERVFIGLDWFRLFIKQIVTEWRISRADKKTSDYVMAIGLLGDLTGVNTEKDVIIKILDLFAMLFAPGELVYMPVNQGIAGQPISFSTAPVNSDDMLALCKDIDADYRWSESGSGFLLRIKYGQETKGILKIGKVAFPRYLVRYLNFSLVIAGVCGLAIANAQKYQQIMEQKNQLARTLEELAAMKEEAVKANRAKSDFLSSMSHELRTPLNAVIGMSHLLLNSELDPKQRRFVEILYRSSDFLLLLINDILDFSRIEADRIELEKTDFNLESMLEETMSILSVMAREKNLEFTVLIEPDVPLFLNGDPFRLRQVIMNLVTNAIKFTSLGGGSLQVSLDREDEKQAVLIFTVKDTGIGIPEDRLDSIFDMFTQVDASTSREHGGTGLGLTISKRLVELMGGKISVTSRRNQGTTFRFNAVFNKQAAGSQEDRVEGDIRDHFTLSESTRRDASILLAEDNFINQEVLQEQLKSKGFHSIIIAENGRKAVDLALQHSPDLVLMDVQMPEMDGNEATRELRRKGYAGPIVVLSASVAREKILESLQAGAVDYITKPVNFDTFFSKIVKYLNEEPGPLDEDTAAKESSAKEEGYRIKESCSDNVRKVFLNEAARQSKILAAIGDADTLEQRRKEISFTVHGFKGNARYLGLQPLETAAAELDSAFKANEPADRLLPLVGKLAQILNKVVEENADKKKN